MTGSRPLTVGVTDLVRRPGVRRPVHREVILEHLGITTASVDPDVATVIDLELEWISPGLVTRGTIVVPWVGDCRRCLEEVHATTEVDVREVFDRHPVEGETYPLGDDAVDLLPMVRDVALLAMPLAPLCREDCPGPAPETFPTTVESSELVTAGLGAEDEEDDDAGPPADPRWAALDQLKFDRD